MGFFDQISGMLEQYTSQEQVPREQAHRDYDKIAATVPPNVLGSVIGPAQYHDSAATAGHVGHPMRRRPGGGPSMRVGVSSWHSAIAAVVVQILPGTLIKIVSVGPCRNVVELCCGRSGR